jgi:hypothetical protein
MAAAVAKALKRSGVTPGARWLRAAPTRRGSSHTRCQTMRQWARLSWLTGGSRCWMCLMRQRHRLFVGGLLGGACGGPLSTLAWGACFALRSCRCWVLALLEGRLAWRGTPPLDFSGTGSVSRHAFGAGDRRQCTASPPRCCRSRACRAAGLPAPRRARNARTWRTKAALPVVPLRFRKTTAWTCARADSAAAVCCRPRAHGARPPRGAEARVAPQARVGCRRRLALGVPRVRQPSRRSLVRPACRARRVRLCRARRAGRLHRR